MKKLALRSAVAAVVGFAATVSAADMPTIDASKYGYKTFRMGIMGGENAQDRQKTYECFLPYVSKMFQVPAKIFMAKDYAGTMEGLLGKTLDYAWLGSAGYAGVYLRDKDAVRPIMTRRSVGGALGYHSVLVAREDSGINSLDDLKGEVVGYADPNSTSGFLIPSIEWKKQGYDPDSFFGKTVFSGGHENNVLAVLNGDVKAAVTWVSGVGEWIEGYSHGNLRKMVDKGIVNMDDLKLVWMSKVIPNGPVVVRKDMPKEMSDILFQGFQFVHQTDPDCMEGVVGGEIVEWVEIDHSHYETIIAARQAKIDAKRKKN
jgi:phosphonate transport system substrate-binding protein